MKFEQALRAMRRGEVVRRRGRIDALEMCEGKVYCNGQLDVTPWCMDAILADDWVIIRKKKPVPLRNVFTDPRVGDVVQHRGASSSLEFAGNEGDAWTILGVLPEFVVVRSSDGVWTDAIDRGRLGWGPDGFTVISRQP